jgi:hypothetical protein
MYFYVCMKEPEVELSHGKPEMKNILFLLNPVNIPQDFSNK